MWFPYKAHGDVIITPSVLVEEQYDSNFFVAEEVSSVPRDTFVTTIAPSLRFTYDRKNLSFDVFYGHNFRYLTRTSETLDDGENNTSLTWEVPFSERTSLLFSESISYASTSATRLTEETGIQIPRTQRITSDFSLGLSHAVTPRTTAHLTLRDYQEIFLDSPLIDSRKDSANFVTNHQLTDKTAINMVYGYSLYTFDTSEGEQNVENHSLSLGITKIISSTLSLNISGGVSYRPGLEGGYTTIGQAGFSKAFQQSSLTLGYSRSVTSTFGLTDEISINDTFSTRWNYPVSTTGQFGIYGTFSKNQSETSSVDTTSYTAGIDSKWRPYSWMSAGIGYSHTQQRADGTLGEDLSRDQVSVTITATPAGWSF
jgi:hypothetical protein